MRKVLTPEVGKGTKARKSRRRVRHVGHEGVKVVYKIRVLGHFVSWNIFGLEGIRTF